MHRPERVDRISLTGMVFQACHGMHEEEQTRPQRFEVDVELYGDLKRAGVTDDLNHTFDYTSVYDIAREVVSSTQHRLLEKVAYEIGQRCLEATGAEAVTVRVRKPGAPLPGPFGTVEVEITVP